MYVKDWKRSHKACMYLISKIPKFFLNYREISSNLQLVCLYLFFLQIFYSKVFVLVLDVYNIYNIYNIYDNIQSFISLKLLSLARRIIN